MKLKMVSFVVGSVPRTQRGEEAESVLTRSAPPYAGKSTPKQLVLSREDIKIDGDREAQLIFKSYHPNILLVEIVLELEVENIFEPKIYDVLRDKLLDECLVRLKKRGFKDPDNQKFYEEYTVFVLKNYTEGPEGLMKNKDKVAAMLKSEVVDLDPTEVDYTIASQIKYEKNDLIIVDWDGALVLYPEEGYEESLSIFELANLQLLRYRLLDRELDERLERAVKLVGKTPVGTALAKARSLQKAFQEIIAIRTESIARFEALERDIKLIGDWYYARLYELLSKKFRLEEWRKDVKDKLESLEDIYSIVSENLGMSTNNVLELIQIVAFFVLQAGWFVIIILEFIYFTR